MQKNLQNRYLATLVLAFVLFTANPQLQAQSVDRVALIEQVTSASCGPCAAYNPAFNSLLESQDVDDLAIIKYQYDGGAYQDLMGEFNVGDVSARIFSYYGGTGFPTVWLEGNYHGSINSVSQSDIDGYLANPAWYDIYLDQEVIGDSLIITADFTALKDFQELLDQHMRIWVVVIEKEVQYPSSNPPGYNGELNFKWVMRKMLPSANGQPIGKQFEGNIESFRYAYFIDNSELDPEELRAIAFVQNFGTKEVHNSVMWREGLNPPPNGIEFPEIGNAKAYPTLVDNFITLEFSLQTAEFLRFELYDINGNLIEKLGTDNYAAGINSRSFVLRDLPYGTYFAHIRGERRGATVQFVVQH